MNALFFSDTNFSFSKVMDHSEKEWERHDLSFEEIQRARNEWNKEKMKQIKPLPPESQLSNFYHPSVN